MKQALQQDLGGLYGRGWGFPPAFDTEAGVQMVADAQDIHQSMLILFNTTVGERIMRRDYGCDLQSAVFDNITADLVARIRSDIGDGIARHEPRVALELVEITQDARRPNLLQVMVSYRIRNANEVRQLSGQLDIGDGRRGVFV